MADDKIIDKVKKLLRLATSDNIYEASAAAARAQVLITEHQLTDQMLRDESDDLDREAELVEVVDPGTGKKMHPWRRTILSALCHVNYCCYAYNGNTSRVRFVGRDGDIAIVRYMYEYLCREVDRLRELAFQDTGMTYPLGNSIAWNVSFRHGAAASISARVMAQARAAHDDLAARALHPAQTTALVRASHNLEQVREASLARLNAGPVKLKMNNYKPQSNDAGGFWSGYSNGRNIPLTRGLTDGE